MGKASRDKGLRRERGIVQLHTACGLRAERVPLSGATHYRDNGADVDLATCASSGAGAASLCTVWEDPSFRPEERAFYYARVLENPVSRSRVRAFRMASLSWFAQLMGSLSIFEPPSIIRPSTGMPTATITNGSTATLGRLPRRRTVDSTQLGLGASLVGARRSRPPITASGTTMPATSNARWSSSEAAQPLLLQPMETA